MKKNSSRLLRVPGPRHLAHGAAVAFTLVEMLVVMSVIVVLLSLTGPVLNSLNGAGEVNKAVYDIAGILEQARAYAMSNNTYVYVGFQEADVTTSESIQQKDGIGRVSVAVIARKDGVRGYDVNSPASWTDATPYGYRATNGSFFVTIGKVQRFNNLHLVNLYPPPTAESKSGMSRGPYNGNQQASLPNAYNLATTDCKSLTPFDYPLGKALDKGTYSFKKVIQFDPQGVARIQLESNADSIAKVIEIGLQQTHGNSALTVPQRATRGNIAAIQINGMSGSTHIYRP